MTSKATQDLFDGIIADEYIIKQMREAMESRGVLWVSVDRGGAVWGWNFKPTYEGTREWQHNYAHRDQSMATHLGALPNFTDFTTCSEARWAVSEILTAYTKSVPAPSEGEEPVTGRPVDDVIAEYLRDKVTISAERQPNGGVLFSLKIGGETFASSSIKLPVY